MSRRVQAGTAARALTLGGGVVVQAGGTVVVSNAQYAYYLASTTLFSSGTLIDLGNTTDPPTKGSDTKPTTDTIAEQVEAAVVATSDPAKVSRAGTSASSDTAAAIKNTFTGSGFGITVKNFAERWVPMKAGATAAAWLTGYLNEWGAIRGTSPYAWGDALVRAIRVTGDGITSGNALEIEDRTGTTLKRWGRAWIDGTLVRNGYRIREVYCWRTGDADPTVGGTIALPANATWLLYLATADARPTWAPEHTIIVRY